MSDSAASVLSRHRAIGAEMLLTGIYEITKILTTPQSLHHAFAGVVGVLSSFMPMRRCFVLVINADGDPDLEASMGEGVDSATRARSPFPKAVIDRIVAGGEAPLLIDDIQTHPLFNEPNAAQSTAAQAPIHFIGLTIPSDGRTQGVLTVDRQRTERLVARQDEDVRTLQMVATLIGQAMRMHSLLSRDRDRLIPETHRLEKSLSLLTGNAQRGRAPRTADASKAKAIMGSSPVIADLRRRIATVAATNSKVLLRGETGTGKELFARAIHETSPRRDRPFIKVNCAALPETLIESELFGHERGAFTGAVDQRAGRFEQAHGGTLFLDEIGDISGTFQAKLLRVLQEGEFERVGGTETLRVDVRIVCATNVNLEEAVVGGRFRADLYYRLSVVTLLLPPLRERTEDIPALAQRFLDRFGVENGRKMAFEPHAFELLARCAFPGNVRELENCVRRTAALAGGDRISPKDFACRHNACLSATLWKGQGGWRPNPSVYNSPASGELGHADVSERRWPPSREALIDAMERAGWVQAKAARRLGVTPRQIGSALRKHGVDWRGASSPFPRS